MSILAATLLILASGGSKFEASATAPSDQPAAPKQADGADKDDPVVCESSQELGSRLKRRRVCMRRSEWARQRQEDKMLIDRTQVQRGLDPAG